MGSRLRSLATEPLLQFALVGAAIFLVHRAWGARDVAADARIVLDAPRAAHQRQLYQVQFGAPPDALTLETLLQRFAREEALYREGMRLRLDSGDEVIRQRVVQKMETLLADAEVIPEPTTAQLREHYAANVARYTEPGETSFQQLYFAVDGADIAGAEARARKMLALLMRDPQARVDSDALAIGATFTALDAAEVVRRFGATPFARAVGEAPLGTWAGPYASGFGVHLLRVDARSAARTAAFEAVQTRVRDDYLSAARAAAKERRIAQILGHYEVVRADAH